MTTRCRLARFVLIAATLLSTNVAFAQFSQQGPKLAGTGAVGAAGQGTSVSLSADGNTAIVGGPVDNSSAGAAWVFAVDAGVGLVEDAHATGGTISTANSVLGPGETVLVNASWKNLTVAPLALTGTASAFIGPAGATYTLLDTAAGYGTIAPGATADSFSAGGPSYHLSIDIPVTRPAAHWDATFLETLSNGTAKTWTLHIGQPSPMYPSPTAPTASPRPFSTTASPLVAAAVTTAPPAMSPAGRWPSSS
jgi:hypothetical protein